MYFLCDDEMICLIILNVYLKMFFDALKILYTKGFKKAKINIQNPLGGLKKMFVVMLQTFTRLVMVIFPPNHTSGTSLVFRSSAFFLFIYFIFINIVIFLQFQFFLEQIVNTVCNDSIRQIRQLLRTQKNYEVLNTFLMLDF